MVEKRAITPARLKRPSSSSPKREAALKPVRKRVGIRSDESGAWLQPSCLANSRADQMAGAGKSPLRG